MIVYNLNCRKDHLFKAWFRDSAAFDEQAEASALACPTCGDSKIEKAIMAPRLGKGARPGPDLGPDLGPDRGAEPAAEPAETVPAATPKAVLETEKAGQVMKALAELRQKIERNFDHVGPGFAEEARKIHYGETDPRNIYGETSEEQAEALREEGIEFGRIPWLPRHDT